MNEFLLKIYLEKGNTTAWKATQISVDKKSFEIQQ